MSLRILGILAILILQVCRCSTLPVSGTGGQGNGSETVAKGFIYTNNGVPASGATVYLISSTFDPRAFSTTSFLVPTVTRRDGSYQFDHVQPGTYNVESRDTMQHSGVFIQDVIVTDTPKSLSLGISTLSRTSTVSILFPNTQLVSSDYVYIPGSTTSAVADSVHAKSITMHDVIAGTYKTIMLVQKSDSLKVNILDTILMVPADTSQTLTASNTGSQLAKRLLLNTTTSGAGITGTVYNFPVLVRLQESNFDFSEASQNGSDIRFTKSDSTPLAYEIERWDASAKQAEIWVKIDTVLGNTSNQSIIMYWGGKDGSSTPLLSNDNVVFDTSNGFQAVWHCAGNTGTAVHDATQNNFSGTFYGDGSGSAQGVIGMASMLNGLSNYIDIPNSAQGKLDFSDTGSYTLSAWVYADTLDFKMHAIISKGDLQYSLDQSNYVSSNVKSNLWRSIVFKDKLGWAGPQCDAVEKVWTHLEAVHRKNTIYLYVNGAFADSSMNLTYADSSRYTGSNVRIGGLSDKMARLFAGKIDEVRLENVARTKDWVLLSYMNQQIADKLVEFK